ncbi:hypothetical protein IWX91DRAFT_3038 [Phyllosticta citricarpa]
MRYVALGTTCVAVLSFLACLCSQTPTRDDIMGSIRTFCMLSSASFPHRPARARLPFPIPIPARASSPLTDRNPRVVPVNVETRSNGSPPTYATCRASRESCRGGS